MSPGSNPAELDVPVVVKRSARRRRTIGARMVDGCLEVTVPAWLSAAQEAEAVEDMRRRARKWVARERAGVDLTERAALLARRHQLPTPTSITWSDRMNHRWGSCTLPDRTVRIASQLGAMPLWVLDAVIVHELAHLVVRDHSPAFWELANRYPLMERARGYLIAKSGTADDTDDGDVLEAVEQ